SRAPAERVQLCAGSIRLSDGARAAGRGARSERGRAGGWRRGPYAGDTGAMSALKRYNGVAALLAVVVAGCNGGEAQESTAGAAAAAGEEQMRRIINGQTVQVDAREFTEFITLTGTLEASRDVEVAAEESGVIRELFVDKGARVRVGQPIARIDDQVLRAQYDQARSEAALAQETYERQRRLWEDEGIGTEIAYLRAKYGAQTAEANARMLRARLE